MRIPSIIFAIFLILSCSRAKNSNGGGAKISPKQKSDTSLVLLKNEVLHNFSSPSGKDTFRIQVTGPSITKGQVRFQIVTHDNKIIYDENFTTDWLLGYGVEGDTTQSQKENYITNRIDNFFTEKNFLKPAIHQTDRYDADYSDKTAWDDIKSDPTAIGFYYLIGKEDGRRIAYSKRLKKVLLYFNCC